MTGAKSREVLRNLSTLFHCGTAGSQSDEDLLEQFVCSDKDAAEAAFAVLVARHGAMVLGVCRRILGNRHAAEDAFQATFFVLARKASGIARREQLGCWLHGVARRAALDARARATRQQASEKRLGTMSTFNQPDPIDSSELRVILDEELSRLPERHRAAIVLCELEGLSRREAAGRLGVSEGTLSSRLARAKTRLRDRLIHRGLAVSAAALATALTADVHAVTVPSALADSTIQIASLVASGSSLTGVIPTSVVTLTEGVLKAMFLGKLKLVVLGLTTVALVTTGVGVGAQDRPSDEDRLKAVEQKLDRLLEVLGNSATTSPAAAWPPSRNVSVTSAVPKVASPARPPRVAPVPAMPPMEGVTVAAPATVPVPVTVPVPPAAPAAPPVPTALPSPAAFPTPAIAPVVLPPSLAQRPGMPPPTRAPHAEPNSLAARVDMLERRLSDLERALAGLESRLRGVSPKHSRGPSLNAPLPVLPSGSTQPLLPPSADLAPPSADLAPPSADLAPSAPDARPEPVPPLPPGTPASADARPEPVPPVPPPTPAPASAPSPEAAPLPPPAPAETPSPENAPTAGAPTAPAPAVPFA
jgi:RNA polymerase sigma factor (sigma-70 family)